jgi:dTDP-4-amino-4,6-dideoxygalactose transaminase
MIPFNIPPYTGSEEEFVEQAFKNHKICGDGEFTKKCDHWIEETTGCKAALLTTSGTSALEMAALLCDIQPGDEVIMPSFTFSSTANAFVLRGAVIVFVDIRPDTMNIDEKKIEAAITPKTKAICVVHYAGVACEMDTIMDIAHRHHLKVVEDAAQGVMSFYKGKALGSIGDYGCLSFHETKNLSMGEGGAIMIEDENDILRAEIYREKGTNRTRYLLGQVDKYSWVDYGSSYLASDINAAYLWGQIVHADEIEKSRISAWNRYYQGLRELEINHRIDLPFIPKGCFNNAHMFYIKVKDLNERTAFISFMKERGVGCAFHYVPLHSAPAGVKFGRFNGTDEYTTKESNRLVRLPMYFGLTEADTDYVISQIKDFFKND